MTSSPSPSTEKQCSDVVTDAANLSKNKDVSSEHEDVEDEEDDMDFNPFLKEAPSLEASSSLSSEVEEFDADVDSGKNKPLVENVSQNTITQADESLSKKDSESNIVRDTSDSQKLSDDEDAIWRRTRARYSLVGSSLDELETFLQETDDEDDLHNIDDEQEYRKFLAAVLQDGDPVSGAEQENENIDEDEDNDADFELEIEEALGSDLDENLHDVSQEHEKVRRPKTRPKKRQKTDNHQKKFSGKTNIPLRPILPYAPIATNTYMMQNASFTQNDYGNAFTPYQIYQLHWLIYEHVQLLVQVFSLSILEPSKQHIAPQFEKLLREILLKRDEVIASRRVPYPGFCFNMQQVNGHGHGHGQPFFWVPFVGDNVLSVLDVAPLNLVGSYLEDVSIAVKEHQRRRLEVTYDATGDDKERLFPFGSLHSSGDEVPEPSRTNNDQKSKKTVASALVERTKNQTIALVPKEIAKVALRFFPLFNPALFPHKPPPVSVANRFLFTDAEDGLLARGVMEYNTNWKEIQKHFLPCKTPHQIFVRQKNRSCSRAPENPIKAVRRMKTSPLTPQERARIEEGLRVYKLDWISVWKYLVPYRDPTLLARQYRTAVGNQKSYKGDEITKARRRLYDSNRRNSKTEGSNGQNRKGWSTEEDPRDKENCSMGGEFNSGDDGGNNEDEAYVHEAFLSDWRPENQPVPVFTQERLTNDPRMVNFQPRSKFLRPEVHIRPYHRGRRNGCSRVVKLAPDLPPVNLPPTVRIMSQSAFTKYRDEASSKAINPLTFPRPSQSQPEEQSSGLEKGSESDLQMHPLLFQDHEDGSLPYYPLNHQHHHHISGSSSSSFDFFPNNLNLLRYTHQEKHTLNFFNNSLKSKEVDSGVEFHPLLQRTDDGIGTGGGDSGAEKPPENASIPHRNTGNGGAVPRSPSELDLDIRLSSTTRNRESGPPGTSPATSLQNQGSGLPEGNGNGRDSSGGNDEIVMEQEELSDSEDEEMAESVEFECEEMTDSEGEGGGSDSDHGGNLQNQDHDEDEPICEETSKSDLGKRSSLGLSLNPNPPSKLPVTRKSRSSKNTTLPPPPAQVEVVKKPRKRAKKPDPR